MSRKELHETIKKTVYFGQSQHDLQVKFLLSFHFARQFHDLHTLQTIFFLLQAQRLSSDYANLFLFHFSNSWHFPLTLFFIIIYVFGQIWYIFLILLINIKHYLNMLLS